MDWKEQKQISLAFLKWGLCLLVALGPCFLPVPAGLSPAAWIYSGIFLAVVLGVGLEAAPPALICLLGLVAGGILRVGAPGSELLPLFNHPTAETLRWAFSGFSSPLVWLLLCVFMIGLAFEKSGLGMYLGQLIVRFLGKSSLGLAYAVVLVEGILAFFLPSATVRSGGIMLPLVEGIPPLCQSSHSRSRRAIGAYLSWVAFAASCVTSSLFLTAFIPNLITLDMLRLSGLPAPDAKTWFLSIAPVGLLLLLLVPLLTYWIYPPELKRIETLPAWDNKLFPSEEGRKGRLARLMLIVLMVLVVPAWLVGEPFGIATPFTTLLLICLLVLTGVLSWEDVMGHRRAWNAFVWIGAMLSLNAGLDNVGFLDWCLNVNLEALLGITPRMLFVGLLILFFLFRYVMVGSGLYAAVLLPLFLAASAAFPNGDPAEAGQFGLLLSLSLGLSCVLTPYGCGQAPLWLASGYISHSEFYFLGAIFGAIFLAALLLIGLPWISFGVALVL